MHIYNHVTSQPHQHHETRPPLQSYRESVYSALPLARQYCHDCVPCDVFQPLRPFFSPTCHHMQLPDNFASRSNLVSAAHSEVGCS
ncbi:hypothetical protein C8R44DRAFT_173071 [Mycena epipterygia]|nr:hypothetical protein C8R44DRAFT_173071 [Mycena epipterygia]